MTPKRLLAGPLWRAAAHAAFLVLALAVLYAVAVLVAALGGGV